MRRHESRGLHYTLDFPEKLPQARDTILPVAIFLRRWRDPGWSRLPVFDASISATKPRPPTAGF